MFSPTDCIRPKDLHEITRSSRVEGGKIITETQLVK